MSVEAFLDSPHNPAVVLVELRVPPLPAGAVFTCTKVMARPQNAHAALNGALCVTFAPASAHGTAVVVSATLAFGGTTARRAFELAEARLLSGGRKS